MVLTRYKKANEKIAMGLLSFMPREQNLVVLKKTMERYANDPGWQLYLCKRDDDCIGVIGIELDDHTFNVHHICVDPSFRNEGVGHFMVEKVQDFHEPLALSTTSETKDFLAKCWEKQHTI
ncbi:GNAT family N-acetyltransferase [Planococcus sp. CAU13]|uniref:GNAT family N-acetyltransferase n=1 Tax=Planococcus sp. CAU13 TaxID=1541197 RepID=UPI00052FF55B|nr:GNAT family N-acetyltransferase [Planococcus sp. CAU13]